MIRECRVALNSVNRLLQVVERARAVSHKLRNHEKIERVDSGEHSLLLLISSVVPGSVSKQCNAR